MSDGDYSGQVDLLGDPWSPPKETRGRKRHKRIPQIAEKVAVLRASGSTTEQVAALVGLSEPTLRKYYFRELTEGPELAQAVLNQKIWKKAMDGNVPAAKYMQAQFEKGAAKTIARAPAERKEPAKGKKEQRKADAADVGGMYATPAPPKLVVSNA